MNKKKSWTFSDEINFQELIKIRAEVMEKRDSDVRKAAEKIGFIGSQLELLIVGLKGNAESIRDALEPFDSGVRCKDTEQA